METKPKPLLQTCASRSSYAANFPQPSPPSSPPEPTMTFLDLEVPAIANYRGPVCADATPDWSLDALVSELNHIEHELRVTSPFPAELKLGSFASPPLPPPPPPSPPPPVTSFSGSKKTEGDGDGKEACRSGSRPFVMRVPLDEEEESEGESEGGRSPAMELVASGTRFSCADLDWSESEDSDDELDLETIHDNLMRKTSLEEGILFELERENQLRVKDEVRKRVSRFKAELRNEYEKSAAAILQIEKRAEVRREMDRRLDKQYQRKIAEELDYHLTIIQRNHERRSQEEELRIRNDAATEDAKRKEKALLEEKMRQEKAKAEAKARFEAARKDEEAQMAALEAAKRAAKEVAENESIRISKTGNEGVTEPNEATTGFIKNGGRPHEVVFDRKSSVESTGVKVKAADSAIKTEASRLKTYNEVAAQNAQQSTNFVKEYSTCDRQIDKRLRQITGTVENVRAKANELVSIINDPWCPSSISIMMLAKKVVSLCDNPSGSFEGTAFACGHVILLVVSQVPALMDFILAEFHKVCIYTVPKYIQALEPAARSKDYWKMVGYREENGKLETSENYLRRIETYMKLYAALIQTESPGVQNPLGLKEGWAWMARFLNVLPPTASTATALHAFLKMAGFSLLHKYKVQFKKLLNVIKLSFLPALKEQQKPNLASIICKLESYISGQEFLKEPEGWRLRTHLSSREFL